MLSDVYVCTAQEAENELQRNLPPKSSTLFREGNSNPRLLIVLCIQSYKTLSSRTSPMTSLWKYCLFSQKQLCFHSEASETRKANQWPQRWQKASEKQSLEKGGFGRKHGWPDYQFMPEPRLELRSRRPVPRPQECWWGLPLLPLRLPKLSLA